MSQLSDRDQKLKRAMDLLDGLLEREDPCDRDELNEIMAELRAAEGATQGAPALSAAARPPFGMDEKCDDPSCEVCGQPGRALSADALRDAVAEYVAKIKADSYTRGKEGCKTPDAAKHDGGGLMHPQFEATPIEFRWRGGSLRALFEKLDEEAKARPGKTAWRCLPSGAIVALKYRGDESRELKIVRTEAPKDPEKGPERFKIEVNTFVRDFAVANWIRGPHPQKEGVGIGAILVEPRPRCERMVRCMWKDGCDELVVWEPAYDVQHCNEHRFAAGRETTAQLRAQRELIPHEM